MLGLLSAASLLALTASLGAAQAQEGTPEDPAAGGTTIISGSGVYHLPEGVYVPPVLRPQSQEPLPEAPERVTGAPQQPGEPEVAATAAPETPAPETPGTSEPATPDQETPEAQQIDQTPVPVPPAAAPAPAPAAEAQQGPAPQAAPEPESAPEPQAAEEPEAPPAAEPESDAPVSDTPEEAAPPPAVPVAPVEEVTGQPDSPAEPSEEAEEEEEEEGEQIPAELQPPPGDLFAVAFEPASSRLPEGAAPTLGEAADRAKLRPGSQITLMAYAAGEDGDDPRARRLSLARALSIRGFLIQQGIVSTRVEIRPLGASNLSGEADRVDIIVQR